MTRKAMTGAMALAALAAAAVVAGAAAGRATTTATAPVLFDDFSYSSASQLTAHGWIVRTRPGWPGVPGASFRADNVTVGHGILRMTSSTDGTYAGTTQTQVCQQRKFLAGTYASHVRFRDAPLYGPAGDQPVESFYTISPLVRPLDPNYSEIDFEYLPHGGWGDPQSVGYAAWETYSPAPNWIAVSSAHRQNRSLNGWHTLVLQVARGTMIFFVDGSRVARLGGRYYPEVPMSINYNLWFIPGGLDRSHARRAYAEDIDWVYHAAGAVLSPAQVQQTVRGLQRDDVSFADTVPPSGFSSPCNL